MDQTEQRLVASPPPPPLLAESARPNVLLIDDQPARLLVYESILEGVGVNCVRALSGREALDCLLRQSFAVILLDVSMPEMDGFEVARLIRDHPRYQRLPIIFVTGVHVTELDALKGYEVGAIDYITVPIVPEILRSKVALLVELYRRRVELEVLNRDLEYTRAQLETERNQAVADREAESVAAERRYRAIFEHPKQFTIVLEPVRELSTGAVTDWIYRDANAQALKLLKRSRESLINQSLGSIQPDQAEQLAALYNGVLAGGEPRQYETRLGNEDFLVYVFPMGTEAVVSSAIDISARTRAEAEVQRLLHENRARNDWLTAVLNSITEEVYFADRQGRYTYANPAAMRQFGEQIIASVDAMQLLAGLEVHRSDGTLRPANEAPSLRALSGEVIRNEEHIVRMPRTDQLRHRLVSSAPVRDSRGDIIGSVSVVRDITEQKQIEASLREADQRKNIFLATLSHELRNPLAPIRAAARLLESEGISRDDLERTRSIIARQVGLMAALLNDLLDVSRLSRGKLELKRSAVSLSHILDCAIETAQPEIEAKHHRLQIDPPESPLMLEVDALRLTQALSNLLINAAKYTPHAGHIHIWCRLETDGLSISVEDNGVGLGAGMLNNIFEMFAQIDSAGGPHGGLGIGLFLAKSLVELHGGRIRADSAGADQGSTFTVWLPSSLILQSDGAAEMRLERDAHTSRSNLRVLIADDNVDGAEILCMLLRHGGHQVYVAYDGQEAWELANKVHPDVALLDIGMPALSGYEVSARIRTQPWGESMHIVALTGWGQDEDKQQARAAGFDRHFVKPVDPQVLESMLASIARKR